MFTYLAYMAHMPNLVGIFASGIYLGITDEVVAVVGFVLTYICKNWIHMVT